MSAHGGGSPLRSSPLAHEHAELGARFTDFGGWEMPLSYPSGTLAEHLACRRGVALFDVSHLGQVRVGGPGAFELLQGRLSNDLRKVAPGRAQYQHLLDEDGSVLDDLIVWWVGDEAFEVMPNASNTARVIEAIGGTDVTATRALIAVQGPHAREALGAVLPDAAAVGRFRVGRASFAGSEVLVAGTGYTGEDGLELAIAAEAAPALWRALLAGGAAPAGLGARDTLRLEAGLPLHGHELGPGITPLQAGLQWVVAFDKGPFIGREALLAERSAGVSRLLRGVLGDGRQPLHAGDRCELDNGGAGTLTSGNYSPVLERGIGLAFLPPASGPGERGAVEVRGRRLGVTVVAPPFHRLDPGR